MKTILIFVSTLDGKVTKWGNPRVELWSSDEDQKYYKNIWNDSRIIVMGSSTFKAGLYPKLNQQLIIVMTREPDKYKSLEIPGRIEFTKETPAELNTRIKKKGIEQMLLVGGPHIASSFLEEQLIDELWLTLEPKLFGSGDNLISNRQLNINLRLIQCEIANEQGTLITKYEVLKE